MQAALADPDAQPSSPESQATRKNCHHRTISRGIVINGMFTAEVKARYKKYV